jgi:hypothetical protein
MMLPTEVLIAERPKRDKDGDKDGSGTGSHEGMGDMGM